MPQGDDCDAAPPGPSSRRLRRRTAILLRIATIAAVATCLYFFVRKMAWSDLGDALADARVWPIMLAAVVNYGCLLGKAVCWRIMLAPRYTVSTARLMRLTIAAFAASVLVPARAGELLRVWILKREDGIPIADGAAVAIAEKLLDAASLLVLVAPVVWLLPELPSWVGLSILACSAIALVLLVGLYIAVGRVRDSGGTSWFAQFIAGMSVLRSPRRFVLAFASLMFTWVCDLAMVDLILYASGIDQPVAAGLLILFTLNLAIAIPAMPGQIGTLEVGALAATQLLGVPEAKGVAFALIYHGIQIVPLVAIGLALEHRLVLGRVPAEARELGVR
jgi:uncharacterized membrane protein YbhN (UPF0104 family)